MMTEEERLVHIVDDDEAIRQSVGFMLRKSGHAVRNYVSGTEFLKSVDRETRGCVLLDVRMPDWAWRRLAGGARHQGGRG